MAARRVLLLDAHGLTAYRCENGAVRRDGEFAADAAGRSAFEAYVRGQRGSVFHLLADVAEEGFQTEDIPAVGGRRGAALIKRKLGRHFHGTPFVMALAQERLTEGRRDRRMLFAALTRPQQFDLWLETLRQAEAPLAGVFSIAQLAAPLVSAADRPERRVLLVMLTRSGLRQTVLEDGRLRISRLTPLTGGSCDEAARACASEAETMVQYLARHGTSVPDAPLTVLVLAPSAASPAFREYCRDSDDLRFEPLDLEAVSRRCGLAEPSTAMTAETLFVHLLLKDTPRCQFAGSDERRFFHLQQSRTGVRAVGLAIFTACLLIGGAQSLTAHRLRQETEGIRQQHAVELQQYQARHAQLPQLPLPADQLHALVDRYDDLVKGSPGPRPLYRQLGAALDDFPDIEVERLLWALGPGSSPTLDAYCKLPPALGANRRALVEILDRLSKRLHDGALDVRILSHPFDTAPDKILKSDVASEPPQFVLRLAQRPR